MHKKFEINPTKIKGGCQSGRKGVPHDSESDLPLGTKTIVHLSRYLHAFLEVSSKYIESPCGAATNEEERTESMSVST